ncbi:CCA tRNA nucleotidyltransferase [Arenibacter sp. ARW7G5Y1]|uniref:CCA tRNA nucleotidyltransferase n=1 Tax=Arenibacter sp. ARW7G5Y1 TaxID=2135619 RepID=UPI000D76E6D4|nr:HD domain-containing protein [Arenibacter sp. ARW7G5Y1]PXX31211.1 tRNA nucleotidyltransferase (CCA-adding enzyme) [Arenibacter sp. ARW7G5Y1]
MKIELKKIIPNYEAFLPLLQLIEQNNGKAMLIGGAVIDGINKIEIKDVDIEVYGLGYEEICKLLEQLNLPSNVVGKAFGVLKTVIQDIEIDLSVPRRENKIGIGHKGFAVELDASMTPKEAGKRRDLTINSMYLNMHTEELVDPFNGLRDLQNGILRATDEKTFIEDPLRVLRIMQLLPRKGTIVEKETIILCQKMVEEFCELPAERVFAEWEKLLLKADKPSMGLLFMRDCGWLKHFPELNDLIGSPQNPIWHPEGDVWVHTCMVIDQAAKLRNQLPNNDWRLAYMFGALLHDVGKPSTTTPDLKAHGHDAAGVPIAENFMKRMTSNKSLIEKVITIVGLHMRPGQLFNSGAKEPAWKRLHNKCRLDVLGWQSKADSAGRTGRNVLNDRHETSEMCFELFQKFGEKEITPLVQGKDLIVLGLKPSKEFGIILAKCYELQLEGEKKEAILLKIENNTI